jgi:hypothetical protein
MNEITNPQAIPEEKKADSQAPTTPTAASQGATTLNLSGQSARFGQSVPFEMIYPAGARDHMQSGARWFFWIAGLSLINTIIVMFEGNWSFLAGLGITSFISYFGIALAKDIGNAANVIAFVLNVLVAAFFVFLGVFAGKGHTWAFIIGLVLYVLDGLIFLAVGDWLPLLFHVFVCYCLYRGLAANRTLKRFEAEEAARLAGPPAPVSF